MRSIWICECRAIALLSRHVVRAIIMMHVCFFVLNGNEPYRTCVAHADLEHMVQGKSCCILHCPRFERG